MILIETSRIQKKHMPLLDRMIIGLVIVVLGVNLYVINCCVNLRQELKILKIKMKRRAHNTFKK